ncbi:MAG: hypothetical protein WCV92_03920 [Candidatus Buchananbacteria bacterium]
MKDIIPPKKGFNRFSDGIKIVSHCPICHFNYEPNEAKVLEESEGAELIYIKCRNCQSAIVALISINQMGISSVGLITDLDSREILSFKEKKGISADDVLEIYQALSRQS